METKHTELPWKTDEDSPVIRQSDSQCPIAAVCKRVIKGEQDADQRFIVLACNCHDDLLEALDECVDIVEHAAEEEHQAGRFESAEVLTDMAQKAQAAIAKATGKE